jgi:hypothetical protein
MPPKFALTRGGKVIATGTGADSIEAAPKYNNFYYSTGVVMARQGFREMLRVILCKADFEVIWFVCFAAIPTLPIEIFMRSSFRDCANHRATDSGGF